MITQNKTSPYLEKIVNHLDSRAYLQYLEGQQHPYVARVGSMAIDVGIFYLLYKFMPKSAATKAAEISGAATATQFITRLAASEAITYGIPNVTSLITTGNFVGGHPLSYANIALLISGALYPLSKGVVKWGKCPEAGIIRNIASHTVSQALFGAQVYAVSDVTLVAAGLNPNHRAQDLNWRHIADSALEGAWKGAIWGGVLGTTARVIPSFAKMKVWQEGGLKAHLYAAGIGAGGYTLVVSGISALEPLFPNDASKRLLSEGQAINSGLLLVNLATG